MDKFFKPCANKELVYLKAPASCSKAPAPSKKEVKASTNGTSGGLAGWLKKFGGESSPSSKEAKASALENGGGESSPSSKEATASALENGGGESSPSSKEANASALENGDGCPPIADGLPNIENMSIRRQVHPMQELALRQVHSMHHP